MCCLLEEVVPNLSVEGLVYSLIGSLFQFVIVSVRVVV